MIDMHPYGRRAAKTQRISPNLWGAALALMAISGCATPAVQPEIDNEADYVRTVSDFELVDIRNERDRRRSVIQKRADRSRAD